MHLDLEHMNLLLDHAGPMQGRDELVDHVLSCDTCATRFRALRDLERQVHLAQPKKRLVRYVLGAAAVLLMSVFPYLYRPFLKETAQFSAHWDVSAADGAGLAVLEKVKQINVRRAIADWQQNGNLLRLIELQNRRQGSPRG